MKIILIFYLNLALIGSISITSPILELEIERRCRPQLIKVKQCQNLFYKYIYSANFVEAKQVNDIETAIRNFSPLINTNCSKDLLFLLCSAFIRFCDPDSKLLFQPCEKNCKKVQTECDTQIKLLQLQWPKELNCSNFPRKNELKSICISKPRFESQGIITSKKPKETLLKKGEKFFFNKNKFYYGKCHYLRHSEKYIFINRTGRCALKCSENDLFTKQMKRIAEIWMSILAALTFLSTIFTCLTCCHNNKLRYPEQPIIFLTLSYNLYSVSLLLRLFFTRSTVSCDFEPVTVQYILIQEGLENTHCAITFLLNFFFSTATHIWWVALTFCWMLFNVFKVSVSNLKNNSGYLHLFAWLPTSMLTVTVLVLRCVEADELLGVCSVGGQSPDKLMTFSIIPKSICLILGMLLLFLGFVSLKPEETKIKANSKNIFPWSTSLTASLAFRIGFFSSIYVVATFISIVCEFYQYVNYKRWKMRSRMGESGKQSLITIFLLNIFMNQVVGINTSIWVWTLDAAKSWKKFFAAFKTLCARRKRKNLIITQNATNKMKYSSDPSQHCKYAKSEGTSFN